MTTTTKTARVNDYSTGSRLDGTASSALIASSAAAAPTGVVLAYLDEHDVWQHLDESRESDYRRMGCEVSSVYVD